MGRGGVLMGISPLQWFPANDPFPDKQSQMREHRDLKHGGEFHRQDAKGDKFFWGLIPWRSWRLGGEIGIVRPARGYPAARDLPIRLRPGRSAAVAAWQGSTMGAVGGSCLTSATPFLVRRER